MKQRTAGTRYLVLESLSNTPLEIELIVALAVPKTSVRANFLL